MCARARARVCVCECVCVCTRAWLTPNAQCAPLTQIVSAQLHGRGGSVSSGPTTSFLFRKVAAPVTVTTKPASAAPAPIAEEDGTADHSEEDGQIYDDATISVGHEPDEDEAAVEAEEVVVEEEDEEEVVKPLTAADQVHAIQVANELGETRTVQLSKSPTGADMQLLVDAQCVQASSTLCMQRHTHDLECAAWSALASLRGGCMKYATVAFFVL